MIQEINLSKLEWDKKNLPLNNENLWALDDFSFKLPNKFIELLNISDGGTLKNRVFSYQDYNSSPVIMESSIEIIYNLAGTTENLLEYYFQPPKFLPANLVAFGEDVSGCQICFDYRTNAKTDNPPVVYYEDELYTGNDCIIFIANNFEEFLAMLSI